MISQSLHYDLLVVFLLITIAESFAQEKKMEIPEFKLSRSYTTNTDLDNQDYILEKTTEIDNQGVVTVVRKFTNLYTDMLWEVRTDTVAMENQEFLAMQNWFQQIEWQELIKLKNLVIYADDPRCRFEGISESITLQVNDQSVSIYLGDFQPSLKDVVYIKTQKELHALNPLYQDLLAVAYLNQSFTLKDIWPCLD
ncbi:MAG: hypothetical protein O9340_15165 [Cyclobacteriaceae bacterium]|jgi:hypothetical protein|nr:hypothetical protein [Cyclobacteriaceae bacterium]